MDASKASASDVPKATDRDPVIDEIRNRALEAAEERRLAAEADPDEQQRKKQRLADAARTHLETLQGEVVGRMKHLGLPVPLNIYKLPLDKLIQEHSRFLPKGFQTSSERDSLAAVVNSASASSAAHGIADINLDAGTASASDMPKATDPDPVLRDATPEEAAAKRRALQENAKTQDLDMDALSNAEVAITTESSRTPAPSEAERSMPGRRADLLLFDRPLTDSRPRPFFNMLYQCYINASLQALFGIQQVRNRLIELCRANADRYEESLWRVAISLTDMNRESPYSNKTMLDQDRLAVTYCASLVPPRGQPIIPRLFWHKYFRNTQEDAHEFLIRVLDPSTGCPALRPLFRGSDASYLHCAAQECHHSEPSAVEHFSNVILELRREDGSIVNDVQEGLDAYMPPETTPSSFRWRCRHCGSEAAPVKTHDIVATPEVLWVQLKRWEPDRSRAHGKVKGIMDAITVNEEDRFRGARYRLESIVCHVGETIQYGHYLTLARHDTKDGAWWYYNDLSLIHI